MLSPVTNVTVARTPAPVSITAAPPPAVTASVPPVPAESITVAPTGTVAITGKVTAWLLPEKKYRIDPMSAVVNVVLAAEMDREAVFACSPRVWIHDVFGTLSELSNNAGVVVTVGLANAGVFNCTKLTPSHVVDLEIISTDSPGFKTRVFTPAGASTVEIDSVVLPLIVKVPVAKLL